MFESFDIVWTKIENKDITDVARMILASINKWEDFVPDKDVIEKIGGKDDKLKILDFGCGIGRNIKGMLEYSNQWVIYGYDNKAMLDRMIVKSDRLFLYDDWEKVKGEKFDVIIATLVFQHIKEQFIRIYLEDITTMTNKFIIRSRRHLDEDRKNIWPIVLDYFNIKEPKDFCIEGNENDHDILILEPKQHAC